jgi:acyl carrier protein
LKESQPGAAVLGADERREVLEGIATILGNSPDSVALDEPILNPGKEIEEFDLLEILIELEDRFDVEIEEEVIERSTGGRFNEVQKRLTPRQLFAIVAEATRAAQQSNGGGSGGDEN